MQAAIVLQGRCMLPITHLSAMIDAGETDAVALTEAAFARIAGPGRALDAFITLLLESARSAAVAAAMRARAGRRLGPLDGIPVALKDNIDVAGVPTSNGFGGLPWRVPAEDAQITRRLRAAGAVVLGKLAMHEGALGVTTDNPHHGRCFNPHGAGLSPGGSSGGAGAAVAAGLCAAAVGTDTAGSVRIPASWCGVVGLKPGCGLISLDGVAPLSERLDHAGPLTRSVADAALLLDVLTDSRPTDRSFLGSAGAGRLDGLRLGVLDGFKDEMVAPAVAAGFEAALAVLRGLGATVTCLRLPGFDPVRLRRAGFLRIEAEAAFVYGALAAAEPARFSDAYRACLDYGIRLPATRLVAADRVIDAAARELQAAFCRVDAIVSPATPQAAIAFDQAPPENAGTFAILANAAGVPAISVPMGRDAGGRPLGLQVIGARNGEATVLRIAGAYEAEARWDMSPPETLDARGVSWSKPDARVPSVRGIWPTNKG